MSLDGLPGVAEVAMQSGHYAGTCVRRRVEGATRAPKPFRYRDLGSAAYLTRARAVVAFGPVRLSGFLAWLIWLLVHIAFLTGFRNRLGAVLTWLVTFSRGQRRERAFTSTHLAASRDESADTEQPGSSEQPAWSVAPGGAHLPSRGGGRR